MKGFFIRLKEVWVILGITLLLFIVVEISFRIYFQFKPATDSRIEADCYQNTVWVEKYYHELAACNVSEWKPYVYWQRKPFEGEFININDQGYRQTVIKPFPFEQKQNTLKLFFFGGSTMWGSGVRDKFTIPSLVGNELAKNKFSADITNLGESGYVSMQEVVKLNLELKKGNIPDIVVFYDGANDIFSSLQSGVAGIPQNENNRLKEFNTLQEKKKSFLVFMQSL
ncbi:MAG: SGNH/GDSL hydrolase family protein, partial [Bacteroidales bacterium]